MGCWGRGLFQSDDDYDIVRDLSAMFGCDIFTPENEERAGIVKQLNDGLLARKFDKIMAHNFQPATSYHSRDRIVIILGILAMQLGAKIEHRHLTAMKVLRSKLPDMVQQLQVVTALDEYKNNGTEWVLGSKGLVDTMGYAADGKTEYENGDGFWSSGLGHSADEDPYPHTYSKKCLSCGDDEAEPVRCSRCQMARYCNRDCQKRDWPVHKQVCVSYKPRSIRVPDLSAEKPQEPEKVDTATETEA